MSKFIALLLSTVIILTCSFTVFAGKDTFDAEVTPKASSGIERRDGPCLVNVTRGITVSEFKSLIEDTNILVYKADGKTLASDSEKLETGFYVFLMFEGQVVESAKIYLAEDQPATSVSEETSSETDTTEDGSLTTQSTGDLSEEPDGKLNEDNTIDTSMFKIVGLVCIALSVVILIYVVYILLRRRK